MTMLAVGIDRTIEECLDLFYISPSFLRVAMVNIAIAEVLKVMVTLMRISIVIREKTSVNHSDSLLPAPLYAGNRARCYAEPSVGLVTYGLPRMVITTRKITAPIITILARCSNALSISSRPPKVIPCPVPAPLLYHNVNQNRDKKEKLNKNERMD